MNNAISCPKQIHTPAPCRKLWSHWSHLVHSFLDHSVLPTYQELNQALKCSSGQKRPAAACSLPRETGHEVMSTAMENREGEGPPSEAACCCPCDGRWSGRVTLPRVAATPSSPAPVYVRLSSLLSGVHVINLKMARAKCENYWNRNYFLAVKKSTSLSPPGVIFLGLNSVW